MICEIITKEYLGLSSTAYRDIEYNIKNESSVTHSSYNQDTMGASRGSL